MAYYCIVDSNNLVTGVTVSDSPMAPNWVPGNYPIGSSYDPLTKVFTLPAPAGPSPAQILVQNQQQGKQMYDAMVNRRADKLMTTNPTAALALRLSIQ